MICRPAATKKAVRFIRSRCLLAKITCLCEVLRKTDNKANVREQTLAGRMQTVFLPSAGKWHIFTANWRHTTRFLARSPLPPPVNGRFAINSFRSFSGARSLPRKRAHACAVLSPYGRSLRSSRLSRFLKDAFIFQRSRHKTHACDSLNGCSKGGGMSRRNTLS